MSGPPPTATPYTTLASQSLAADFTVQGVSVLDGDTIEVLHNQRLARISLNGIDCEAMRAI